MANNLNGNPKHIDTAGATSTMSRIRIRLIQWVDTAGDIADNDDLSMTIGNITFALKWQKPSDVGDHNPILTVAGPFNPGIWVDSFTVGTLDGGNVFVWV